MQDAYDLWSVKDTVQLVNRQALSMNLTRIGWQIHTP